MTENQPYHFKRVDESMYKDLIYISKSAFGFDPGFEYYKNKNKTSAFGSAFLGYIAYDSKDEPAAFYGVYACPVEYNNQTYIAAQSGDTMTHKDHTGKGLFTTLARMTYELAKQEGVSFIFGFPNYNSYPGFVKKLQWICPGNLKEFRQKVITLPCAKISKKIPFFSKLYRAYTSVVFGMYQSGDGTFVNSCSVQGRVSIKRTVDFIRYKSFSGSKIIKLNEQNVWMKLDGFLFIGDIERKDKLEFKKLNAKIRRLAFWLGADVIVFQMSPDSFWHREFGKYFKEKDAFPYGYLDLDGKLPLEKLSFVMGDADTF